MVAGHKEGRQILAAGLTEQQQALAATQERQRFAFESRYVPSINAAQEAGDESRVAALRGQLAQELAGLTYRREQSTAGRVYRDRQLLESFDNTYATPFRHLRGAHLAESGHPIQAAASNILTAGETAVKAAQYFPLISDTSEIQWK